MISIRLFVRLVSSSNLDVGDGLGWRIALGHEFRLEPFGVTLGAAEW